MKSPLARLAASCACLEPRGRLVAQALAHGNGLAPLANLVLVPLYPRIDLLQRRLCADNIVNDAAFGRVQAHIGRGSVVNGILCVAKGLRVACTDYLILPRVGQQI